MPDKEDISATAIQEGERGRDWRAKRVLQVAAPGSQSLSCSFSRISGQDETQSKRQRFLGGVKAASSAATGRPKRRCIFHRRGRGVADKHEAAKPQERGRDENDFGRPSSWLHVSLQRRLQNSAGQPALVRAYALDRRQGSLRYFFKEMRFPPFVS